jgi:hypothetical protein
MRYVSLLIAAFFGLGVYSIISHDSAGRNSLSWPTTTGKILKTKIYERTDTVVVVGSTDYYVYVKYVYSVDGKEYTSSKVRFTEPSSFMDLKDAQRERAKFPVNKEVDVYYNPDNPESSCLEPGGSNILITVAEVFMMLIVVGICIFGIVEYGR